MEELGAGNLEGPYTEESMSIKDGFLLMRCFLVEQQDKIRMRYNARKKEKERKEKERKGKGKKGKVKKRKGRKGSEGIETEGAETRQKGREG